MKVSDLRLLLDNARQNSTDPEASEQLSALIDVLLEVNDRELTEFVNAVLPAVAKLAKPTKAKAQKTSGRNPRLVDGYLEALKEARENNDAFEAIVKRIEKDRSLKVADAKELAIRFTGQHERYKTKKDALKAILDRQIVDKRSAARTPQISGIF